MWLQRLHQRENGGPFWIRSDLFDLCVHVRVKSSLKCPKRVESRMHKLWPVVVVVVVCECLCDY